MEDRIFNEEELIRHSELADSLIRAKKKSFELWKEIIQDIEISKISNVCSYYEYISGLLKEYGELNKSITSGTELSIDQDELYKAANEMLSVYNVIKNNSISKTKTFIDNIIIKLQKTEKTLNKCKEKVDIAKANREKALSRRRENSKNAQSDITRLDDMLYHYSSVEFHLTVYGEEYKKAMDYLDKLLKLEIKGSDVDHQRFCLLKNKILTEIDSEITEERAKILQEFEGNTGGKSITRSVEKSKNGSDDFSKGKGKHETPSVQKVADQQKTDNKIKAIRITGNEEKRNRMTDEAPYERKLMLYSNVANTIMEEQRDLVTKLTATRNDPLLESILDVYVQCGKYNGLLKWIDALDRTINAEVGICDDLRGQYEEAKNKLYTESMMKLDDMKMTRDRIQLINTFLKNITHNLFRSIKAISKEQVERKRVVGDLQKTIENFKADQLPNMISQIDEVKNRSTKIEDLLKKLQKSYRDVIFYLDQTLEDEEISYNVTGFSYDIDKNKMMLGISKAIAHESDMISELNNYQERYQKLVEQKYEIGPFSYEKDMEQKLEELNGVFSESILTNHRKDIDSWEQAIRNIPEKNSIKYILSDENKISLIS